MKKSEIYLSHRDHELVSYLVRGIGGKSETVKRLREELARAVVLDAEAVPATAVGLNSRVAVLDLDSQEAEEYVLVMPAASNPDEQRISVLVPLGAALLGYREGDELEWPTPGGMRRLKVLNVVRDAWTHAPQPRTPYLV